MSDRSIDKATGEDIARLRASITATLYALAEVRKQLVERTGVLDLDAYKAFTKVAQPDLNWPAGTDFSLPPFTDFIDITHIDKMSKAWTDLGDKISGSVTIVSNALSAGKDYLSAVVGFIGAIAALKPMHDSLKNFEGELLAKLAGYETQLTALLAQQDAALANRRQLVNRPLLTGEVVLYEGVNFGGDVVDGQGYIADVEIDATSLRIPADTGVTLYAEACFTGASQDIPISVPSLAGSKLNGALPRSAKTWSLHDRPYTGRWAVKLAKVSAQGSSGAPPNDLYLSVKANADNVGILSVAQTITAHEIFGIQQLSTLKDGRQQISFGLTGTTFVPAARSKNIWSLAFDPLQKITYVQEAGYRSFSLMTDQKKWVRYSDDENQVFYLNDYYDERTIFTLAVRIADSEDQLGALDAGEVALYENPVYWGRVWVINASYVNFHAIPGLANIVSSVRLGPDTAATVYHEDVTTTPPTLVREDIVSNVHDMHLSQVGDNAVTAIRAWRTVEPAAYGVRVTSTLSQDYAPDASGTKAADITVYRTSIEVPSTVSKVKVWTTDTATITIGGLSYQTDEDQAAEIAPLAGRIVVTMQAAKLTAPALKLQLDSMTADERIVIFADHSAHERLLALDAATLAQAKDSHGRDLIPAPQDTRIPRSAVADVIVGVVQATIPAAQASAAKASNGMAMGATYRLNFAQEGAAPSFSLLSPAEASAQGVLTGSSLASVTGFFDDLFNSVSDWTTAKFDEIKRWIDQGVDFLITQVNNGLQIIIKGFENEVLKPLKEFVLTSAQAVAEFVEMVIEKIGVVVEEFVRFIRALFQWQNFLTTQATLKAMFNYAIDKLQAYILSAEAPIRGFFKDSKQLVTREIDDLIRSLGGNPQANPANNKVTIELPDLDIFNWLMDKIVSALKQAGINLPVPKPSQELLDLIQAISDAFSEVAGSFVNIGQALIGLLIDPKTGTPVNPSVYVEQPQVFAAKLLEIVKQIANSGLTIAEQLIILVLRAVNFIIGGIQDMLNHVIDIPFLSDLFKNVVGIDLSLINVGTLLLAVPVTVLLGEPLTYDTALSDAGIATFNQVRAQAQPPRANIASVGSEVAPAAILSLSAADATASPTAVKKLEPPVAVAKAMKAINICASLAGTAINAVLDTLTLPEGADATTAGIPKWTLKDGVPVIGESPAKGLEIASLVLSCLAWGTGAPSNIFLVPHVHTFGNAGKDDGSSDYWENVVWFYAAGGLFLDTFTLVFHSERLRRADVLGVVLATIYNTGQLALVSTLTAKRRDTAAQADNFDMFMGLWPSLTSWLRIKEVVVESEGISIIVLAALDILAGLSTFSTGIVALAK